MLGWLKDHSKRSKGANRFEYWYVPISLLLPAIGVLESWAALEIVVGPKPYPTNAPQRGATRPERQIHRLQKRQIGRLAAALPKFRGYGGAGRPEGIWRDILESRRDWGGRYGRGMKCAPEGSWGSCREQFRPKRETVSVCRRIGLDNRPCNQQNFSGKIVKTIWRFYLIFSGSTAHYNQHSVKRTS